MRSTAVARQSPRSAPRCSRNYWLLGGLVLGNLLHFGVIYTETMNRIFHTVPIPLADFFLIGAVASLVLWVEEARKFFARRRSRDADPSDPHLIAGPAT